MRFLSSSPLLWSRLVPNPSFLASSPPLLLPPIQLGTASSPPELSAGASSQKSRPLFAGDLLLPAARGAPVRRLSLSPWFCLRSAGVGRADMEITAVAAAAAVEGSVARRFWIKAQKEALLATYTPFVVCLITGGLELDAFRRYIAQDVHFLRAFAQAYEMAGDCADDDDAKAAISELRKSVLKELKMHNSIVEAWGVDVTKEIPPNPATVKYTSFLLATAAGKVEGGKGPAKIVTPFEKTRIAAYTIAAMTPCMRLYAFLGKEVLRLLGPDESNHPYRKWIKNYSSPEFEAAALQMEELLDKLSISLTGEELEVIEKLYYQGVKLEIEFFSAQALDQQTIVPLTKLHDPSEQRLVLFPDFDLTCTEVDSSAILAEIAILSAPKADLTDSNEPLARMSSADLRNSWDVLSTQYTEEFEQCIENVISTEKAKEFDYKGLCEALEQLSEFEKRANMRVCESGVLRGLNVDDIKRAGERLILQDGCRNFFQNFVTKKDLNAEIHVLSYCWCGDLIRSALSSGDLNVLNIHSNEFSYKESISTGEIVKKMETPLDKIRTFKDILNNCGDGGKHFSVYIGDSVGDLLCLLEADVGIVIGSSASLRRVGSHYGVSFVPLISGLVKKQRQLEGGKESFVWNRLSGVLYTVSSWGEVRALILGV